MIWNEMKILKGDNVKKYVFSKPDAVAEAVLYKYPTYRDRTVICCSTQSGCPVGCRFCGAGDAFVRSLTQKEITSQPIRLLIHACQEEKINAPMIKNLQIMFMSMGEPLLNLKNLIPALGDLNLLYPNASLLISTIGPDIDYEPIMQACSRIEKVGLQFSIHETTNERRNALIPFAAKLTLEQISARGADFYTITRRTPFFNYCVHESNNTQADADRLRQLFHPLIWQATISVICERDEHVAAANDRQRELAQEFHEKLRLLGYQTRVFDPAGQDDIGGGCGQLWYVQDWMNKNPTLAHPSIGRGLPIVHTPRTAA